MQDRESGEGRVGLFERGEEGYKMCEERVSTAIYYANDSEFFVMVGQFERCLIEKIGSALPT
jgi:hypothetical protein